MSPEEKIKQLILETEQWRNYHRSRHVRGDIEVLACNIRIKALKDALAQFK